jgi:DNA-binding response OmpR family regulator
MSDAILRKRILVVEDCLLLAETICDLLADNGLQAVGPVGSVARAMDLLGTARVDGALVDYRLYGGPSLALCQVLRDQHVPFIVLTGLAEGLPSVLDAIPVIEKPFKPALLISRLKAVTSGPALGSLAMAA